MKMHLQHFIKQAHDFRIGLGRLVIIYDLHLITEVELLSLMIGIQRLIILGGAI